VLRHRHALSSAHSRLDHLDLRERYAGLLSKLSADVYPIGAVVPLMESYRYADLSNVIMACRLDWR